VTDSGRSRKDGGGQGLIVSLFGGGWGLRVNMGAGEFMPPSYWL